MCVCAHLCVTLWGLACAHAFYLFTPVSECWVEGRCRGPPAPGGDFQSGPLINPLSGRRAPVIGVITVIPAASSSRRVDCVLEFVLKDINEGNQDVLLTFYRLNKSNAYCTQIVPFRLHLLLCLCVKSSACGIRAQTGLSLT